MSGYGSFFKKYHDFGYGTIKKGVTRCGESIMHNIGVEGDHITHCLLKLFLNLKKIVGEKLILYISVNMETKLIQNVIFNRYKIGNIQVVDLYASGGRTIRNTE